ncbi:TPA: hypothetical protein ACQVHH_005323, partial [Serratia marcescens]
NHSAISPEIRKKILRERYKNQLIADGLETGHLKEIRGNIYFVSKLSLESFAGFVFEAYLVSLFNRNKNIGRAALTWCSCRQRQVMTNIYEKYKAIGTGFITTKALYPHLYAPQSRSDIIFIRNNLISGQPEPATENPTTNIAGIQVKAIRSNFKSEIIDPIVSGKYSHVITLLNDQYGTPSRTTCLRELDILANNGSIHPSMREFVSERIKGPEFLGISQRDVEDYYDYIRDFFSGSPISSDENINDAMDAEIKRYKYKNGLLVPENFD